MTVFAAEKQEVAKKWVKASRTFDKLAWSQTESYISLIDSILRDEQLTLTNECRKSLVHVTNGLSQRKLWAIKCKLLNWM